jgi:hypothetical protein
MVDLKCRFARSQGSGISNELAQIGSVYGVAKHVDRGKPTLGCSCRGPYSEPMTVLKQIVLHFSLVNATTMKILKQPACFVIQSECLDLSVDHPSCFDHAGLASSQIC